MIGPCNGARFNLNPIIIIIITRPQALNCDVDLGWFEHIVPCGIEDR